MQHLTKQVCVRLRPNLLGLLKHVTQARGEDISSFIRRALLKELAELSFLSQEERKALGLGGKLAPDRAANEDDLVSKGEKQQVEVSPF